MRASHDVTPCAFAHSPAADNRQKQQQNTSGFGKKRAVQKRAWQPVKGN